MNKMSYKEKFVQMNKEAKATWIVAAVIIIFWWLAGFGVYGAFGFVLTILGMPAWFVLSCFGSWILSIVLVAYLIKKVYKDLELDDAEFSAENKSGKENTDE